MGGAWYACARSPAEGSRGSDRRWWDDLLDGLAGTRAEVEGKVDLNRRLFGSPRGFPDRGRVIGNLLDVAPRRTKKREERLRRTAGSVGDFGGARPNPSSGPEVFGRRPKLDGEGFSSGYIGKAWSLERRRAQGPGKSLNDVTVLTRLNPG